jgi:hypothetical protein
VVGQVDDWAFGLSIASAASAGVAAADLPHDLPVPPDPAPRSRW